MSFSICSWFVNFLHFWLHFLLLLSLDSLCTINFSFTFLLSYSYFRFFMHLKFDFIKLILIYWPSLALYISPKELECSVDQTLKYFQEYLFFNFDETRLPPEHAFNRDHFGFGHDHELEYAELAMFWTFHVLDFAFLKQCLVFAGFKPLCCF